METAREVVLESAHSLMSAAMIDAKRARMRAELERQMLANRLARLQSEELRATKRIEETVHQGTAQMHIVSRAFHNIDWHVCAPSGVCNTSVFY